MQEEKNKREILTLTESSNITTRDTHLCDVITIHLPSARTRDSASHSNRLATGSIPVVGSSKNTTGGSPTSDMAVLSFRLLPPLKDGKVG